MALWLDSNSAIIKNGGRITVNDISLVTPGPNGVNEKSGRMEIVPVVMSTIEALSSIRIQLPKDLKSMDHRLDLRKLVEEVKRRFPDSVPCLDPIKNMGIKDESFKNLVKACPLYEQVLTF